MASFHVGDRVKIEWQEGQLDRLNLEGLPSSRQGYIAYVSNDTADDWAMHRVKLLSGREVNIHPSQLTLLTEA